MQFILLFLWLIRLFQMTFQPRYSLARELHKQLLRIRFLFKGKMFFILMGKGIKKG